MAKQSKRWTVGVAIVAIACLSSCGTSSSGPGESPASAPPRRTVSALGRIQPGEGVIEITGAVGERIETIVVVPGQAVKQGQELLEIVAAQVLKAQVDLAQAKLQQARQLLDLETKHGAALVAQAEVTVERARDLPDLQIAAQEAEIKVVENQLQQAELDRDRMKSLTSQADQDRQVQAVDRYREQLRAIRARMRLIEKEKEIGMREAERALAAAKDGTAKAQAAIDLDTAQQNVALAEAEFARATVLSPVDAIVMEVFAQAGETIGQRPVMTLAQTEKMFVVAEVYESDIRFIKPGQKATISSKSLAKELTGRVERIGQVVRRNEVFGIDPTARTDARILEVRIALDPSEEAPKRIGLQVDVTISLEEKEGENPAA